MVLGAGEGMIGQNRPATYGARFWEDLPHSGLYTGIVLLPMALGGLIGARIDRRRSEQSGRSSHFGLIAGLVSGAVVGAAGMAAYTALDTT